MSGPDHLTDERAQELSRESPRRGEAEHLRECAPCRAGVASYAELSRALGDLPLPPAPGIAGAVLARIEERRSARTLAWLGFALLAAGFWAAGLLLRLWLPTAADGTAWLAGAAAWARVAGALGPALLPLQAIAGVGCTVVAVPCWLALRALLPLRLDWRGSTP